MTLAGSHNFKKDSIMNLETFSFEIDADGVAHAVFDVPGRSMNTLTGKAIADIIAITNEITSNDKIVGAVISSGKASGFCAGADLGEMGEQAGGKPAAEMSEAELKAAQFERGFSLNKTLRELETCGKPVACALNGLALGGGLEGRVIIALRPMTIRSFSLVCQRRRLACFRARAGRSVCRV